MKVRAVAGDLPFMTRVETAARHLAFSLRPDQAGLEELEAMRAKLAAAASLLDLKRREGGIAEIEFATRLLQLHHVSGHPDLERGGVFGALELLHDKGLIPTEYFTALHDGYAFFRRLLNRARMMRGSTSSCIPEAPETVKRLAHSLGLKEDLAEQIEAHCARVHKAYRHVYDSLYGTCLSE